MESGKWKDANYFPFSIFRYPLNYDLLKVPTAQHDGRINFPPYTCKKEVGAFLICDLLNIEEKHLENYLITKKKSGLILKSNAPFHESSKVNSRLLKLIDGRFGVWFSGKTEKGL
jgi:hypothetical protein